MCLQVKHLSDNHLVSCFSFHNSASLLILELASSSSFGGSMRKILNPDEREQRVSCSSFGHQSCLVPGTLLPLLPLSSLHLVICESQLILLLQQQQQPLLL